MTTEGRLLAALSHLQSAYESAFKAAACTEDADRAALLFSLGQELCDLYIIEERKALKPLSMEEKVSRSVQAIRDAFKTVEKPDSTITPLM